MRSNPTLALPVCLLFAALGAGCFETTGPWQDAPPAALTAVQAGANLVVADPGRHALLIAETAADGSAQLRYEPLPRPTEDATLLGLTALPAGDGVVALMGVSSDWGQGAVPEGHLALVPLVGPGQPTPETRTYPLGAPFTGLLISPEGDSALCFYEPNSHSTVFANPNELAFVDLTAPSGAAPLRRTLPSLGGTPLGWEISPAVGERRYAAVLSYDHVALLDLSVPGAAVRSVPLTSLSSVGGAPRVPTGVHWAADPNGAGLWGVVTTQAGHAAFALHIQPTPLVEGSEEAPFEVSLTQLAGVAAGGDVVLQALPSPDTGDGATTRLVALLANPQTGELTLTDLETAEAQVLGLGAGVQRISPYVHQGLPHVVVFAPGQATYHLLDLAAVDAKKLKAARTREAHLPLADLTAIPDTSLLAALHEGTSTNFSVLDADNDRITPFSQTGDVQELQLSRDGRRLLVRTAVAQGGGLAHYLVDVDLETLHPQAARIPGTAASSGSGMWLMPSAGDPGGPERAVAVLSAGGAGALHLWPLETVSDATRTTHEHLMLHDLGAWPAVDEGQVTP